MEIDTVGVQIRDARRAAGYSQEGLATCIGVGQQLISKWERDIAVPGDGHLISLRRALKAPLEVPPDDVSPKSVYDEIRSRIEQRVYAPGDALPAHSSMAMRYRAHIDTVRRAVNRLVDEGWLMRRPGLSPVVRLREPPSSPNVVPSPPDS